jgi:hypothetical protein
MAEDPVTNESAERLREWIHTHADYMFREDGPPAKAMLDEALAAERRATVERVRAVLDEAMQPYGAIDDAFKPEILAILDAEAKR